MLLRQVRQYVQQVANIDTYGVTVSLYMYILVKHARIQKVWSGPPVSPSGSDHVIDAKNNTL